MNAVIVRSELIISLVARDPPFCIATTPPNARNMNAISKTKKIMAYQ